MVLFILRRSFTASDRAKAQGPLKYRSDGDGPLHPEGEMAAPLKGDERRERGIQPLKKSKKTIR